MYFKTIQFTTEALSSPYPYTWKEKTLETGYAVFITDGGREIRVFIESDISGTSHEIEFLDVTDGGTHKLTKQGNEFKVMSTVLAIVSEYIKKFYKDMTQITFTGEKPGSYIRSGESGRERIYKRLFNKYAPPGKWDKTIKTHGYKTEFIYTKK